MPAFSQPGRTWNVSLMTLQVSVCVHVWAGVYLNDSRKEWDSEENNPLKD